MGSTDGCQFANSLLLMPDKISTEMERKPLENFIAILIE